jgi:hypothetical protein
MADGRGAPDEILARLERGEPGAAQELLPLVYTEL